MITLYLRYTFPPPRHEFNSRREIDGYESVRSSGKIVLFCFHTLFRLDYRFFFFSPFFFFSQKSIYLSIHLFIYLSRPFFIPHHRRKLSMIHLSAELISFQSLPPFLLAGWLVECSCSGAQPCPQRVSLKLRE